MTPNSVHGKAALLAAVLWGVAGVGKPLPCYKALRSLAPGNVFLPRRPSPDTESRYGDLVHGVDAAKKKFYDDENLPETDLLDATARLWDAAGLRYKRVPIPEAKNLEVPAHTALRLLPDQGKEALGLNHYVEAIFRIYGHSTLYDPVALRKSHSTGLRRNRDVWNPDGTFSHYEPEVLISDAAARDLTIKDTLTHEAIHLHSAALRALGIDSDLAGFVMGQDNSKLSAANTSSLYTNNMWLEEIATAAHDAYRDWLEVRAALQVFEAMWEGSADPGQRQEIEKKAAALFTPTRLGKILLRMDDLKWVSVQVEDVARRLGKSFAIGGQPVKVLPQTIEGRRWLRIESKEAGLDYLLPLLGPELSALPENGLGILPLVERRMKRLEALGAEVKQLALEARMAGEELQQVRTLSLAEWGPRLDRVIAPLEKARIETNRSMPKRAALPK